MPTKSEKLVKISPGYSETFGVICDFYRIAAKVVIFITAYVNSGVTAPNQTKLLHNAEKFMPFSLLKSELRYCNRFRIASTPNEGMSPKSPIMREKLVAKVSSWEGSQSDILGYEALLYAYQS